MKDLKVGQKVRIKIGTWKGKEGKIIGVNYIQNTEFFYSVKVDGYGGRYSCLGFNRPEIIALKK